MARWNWVDFRFRILAAVLLAALFLPVAVQANPAGFPDFQKTQDVTTKKVMFFRFLKPLVEAENQRLLDVRRRLGYIQDHIRFGRQLNVQDRQWFVAVLKEFRLSHRVVSDPGIWPALLRRVDAVPVDLVLVQAANESGWGTSRFAREGNNFFGEWCFRPGCGIVPAERPPGAVYEVATFDSVGDCISSYLRNLNTGRVYRHLRIIRERCRDEGRSPEADELARALSSYSQRGKAYVQEICTMLRQNAPVIAQLGLQ